MVESRETEQKKLIAKKIAEMNHFFTAEELHNIVTKLDNRIGIATIYRFLRDLREKREIHSYNCERKSIYSKSNINHSHFKCEACGKISHLKIDSIDFIKKIVSADICHFQIEVSGLCDNCKKSKVYK